MKKLDSNYNITAISNLIDLVANKTDYSPLTIEMVKSNIDLIIANKFVLYDIYPYIKV